MDRERRSNRVLLGLIGVNCAVIIAAEAFPGTEMRRNVYSSRAACEADYSPAQCQQSSSGATVGGYHGGSGGGGHWLGPSYAANRSSAAAGDPVSGRFGLQVATATSIRGGFGHFGHGIGRGG